MRNRLLPIYEDIHLTTNLGDLNHYQKALSNSDFFGKDIDYNE